MIKKHCHLGMRLLNEFPIGSNQIDVGGLNRLRHSSIDLYTPPIMRLGAIIAQTHHEKWDGTGYPSGLAGTDIPIEGRITAVADVFDAMSSRRHYKEAIAISTCFESMERQRGPLIEILEARGERYGSPDVNSEEEARRRAEGIRIDG